MNLISDSDKNNNELKLNEKLIQIQSDENKITFLSLHHLLNSLFFHSDDNGGLTAEYVFFKIISLSVFQLLLKTN
jgi:hypothetical protein